MPSSSPETKRLSENRRLHKIAEYWLVDQGKKIDDPHRKQVAKETEQYAEKILPQLGFRYVLPLNRTIRIHDGRNHHLRQTFPFDFYCEKNDEKWFVEATAYFKKDIPRTPLWGRLGLRIGVLFIRRDLQKYCFKEGTDKSYVILRLKDIGLEPMSKSDAIRLGWETRRRKQDVK